MADNGGFIPLQPQRTNFKFKEPWLLQAGLLAFQYMSYKLNSLKGFIEGTIKGTTVGNSKGDTRSIDYKFTWGSEGWV